MPNLSSADLAAASLDLAPATASVTAEPIPATPPSGVVEVSLLRTSEAYPAPVLSEGLATNWDPGTITVTQSEWGRLRVFVDGEDVTFFRDAPIQVGRYASREPFGDSTAAITIPAVTPLDSRSVLDWWGEGRNVEIVLVPPTGAARTLWAGVTISAEMSARQTSWSSGEDLVGALWQADYSRMPQLLTQDRRDIGTAIPAALNSVVSKRWGTVPNATTGIFTRDRGQDTSVLRFCQEILAQATTDDGANQWTVTQTARRTYRVRLKDVTTVHATFQTGGRGVEVNLSRDLGSAVNVIFGRGVGEDGYAWAGWVYPNLQPDDAPAYPNVDAGNTINLGDTDADTDSGTGVSTWERRVRELGYPIAIDGVYSAGDVDICRQVQGRFGIQVDGSIGPQTWAATFAVGSNAGSLDGAYRKPLAILSEVDPNTYAVDGGITGTNPAYDPAIMRIERDINYGSGISRGEATRSAQATLNRENTPAWAGTIRTTVDPAERSRFEVRAGMNALLKDYMGDDLLVHIAEADHDLLGLTSTYTVDERGRDMETLAQIIQRNKETAPDPARLPGALRRRSQLSVDQVVEFDGESSAGVIPRHGIFGGLWNVLQIPVSQLGRIAKLEYTTSSPASKFCLALFGKPITANQLASLVGNPLSQARPFVTNQELLEDSYGFIEAWGASEQGAGYWPGSEFDGDPLTGKHKDFGGVEYVSANPPWVWVAEYANASCFGEGRLFPAPVI